MIPWSWCCPAEASVRKTGGNTKDFCSYNGYWFFGRPTVEELRLDLRAVLQRCRRDWDISSTEQRTAWANGDKAAFYPYGRTQAQMFAEQD